MGKNLYPLYIFTLQDQYNLTYGTLVRQPSTFLLITALFFLRANTNLPFQDQQWSAQAYIGCYFERNHHDLQHYCEDYKKTVSPLTFLAFRFLDIVIEFEAAAQRTSTTIIDIDRKIMATFSRMFHVIVTKNLAGHMFLESTLTEWLNVLERRSIHVIDLNSPWEKYRVLPPISK